MIMQTSADDIYVYIGKHILFPLGYQIGTSHKPCHPSTTFELGLEGRLVDDCGGSIHILASL